MLIGCEDTLWGKAIKTLSECETVYELFKIQVHEVPSFKAAIRSDKPNLSINPSPSSVINPALIFANAIH